MVSKKGTNRIRIGSFVPDCKFFQTEWKRKSYINQRLTFGYNDDKLLRNEILKSQRFYLKYLSRHQSEKKIKRMLAVISNYMTTFNICSRIEYHGHGKKGAVAISNAPRLAADHLLYCSSGEKDSEYLKKDIQSIMILPLMEYFIKDKLSSEEAYRQLLIIFKESEILECKDAVEVISGAVQTFSSFLRSIKPTPYSGKRMDLVKDGVFGFYSLDFLEKTKGLATTFGFIEPVENKIAELISLFQGDQNPIEQSPELRFRWTRSPIEKEILRSTTLTENQKILLLSQPDWDSETYSCECKRRIIKQIDGVLTQFFSPELEDIFKSMSLPRRQLKILTTKLKKFKDLRFKTQHILRSFNRGNYVAHTSFPRNVYSQLLNAKNLQNKTIKPFLSTVTKKFPLETIFKTCPGISGKGRLFDGNRLALTPRERFQELHDVSAVEYIQWRDFKDQIKYGFNLKKEERPTLGSISQGIGLPEPNLKYGIFDVTWPSWIKNTSLYSFGIEGPLRRSFLFVIKDLVLYDPDSKSPLASTYRERTVEKKLLTLINLLFAIISERKFSPEVLEKAFANRDLFDNVNHSYLMPSKLETDIECHTFGNLSLHDGIWVLLPLSPGGRRTYPIERGVKQYDPKRFLSRLRTAKILNKDLFRLIGYINSFKEKLH